MPSKDNNLLFIDFETSGLDPAKHEALEVAAILTSPDGETILEEYEAKMPLDRPEVAQKEALEINGYSQEKWANACPRAEVVDRILGLSRRATLVAHNAAFDEGFLSALVTNVGRAPNWSFLKIDTVALGYLLKMKYPDLLNVRLATLAEFFKLPAQPNHSAMADARACREFFLVVRRALMAGLPDNVADIKY